MTDNIFDRLAELLQSAGPVNWRLGAQIAESVAGTAEPVEPWVAEEYEELGRTAAMLIERSGAADASGVPPITITDARAWAGDNLENYGYLAEPLAEKLSGGSEAMSGMGLEAIFTQLGPALVGLQMGSLVGTIARSMLGPFDAGMPPAGGGPSLIVPNVEALAASEGLDQRQTRLWAVLRETAHQALLRIDWLGDHLAGLAADYIGGLEMRPDQLQERLGDLQDPAELERLMSEPGGLTGFAAGPELEGARNDLIALVALIDGYGRTVVSAAAADLLPDLAEIERAASQRDPDLGPARMFEQMLGIEIDPGLAGTAAEFVTQVEARWGIEARDRLWVASESLPTLAELHDPLGWAARVLLPDEI